MSSRNVVSAFIAAVTIVFAAACSPSDVTQPSNGVTDSSAVATVEISLGRNIGDGLLVLDTITVVATVKDYRDKPADDALVSWGLASYFDLLTKKTYTGGSIVRTGARTALLTINEPHLELKRAIS